MRIFASLFSVFLIVSMISSGCSKSSPTEVDTLRVHDTLTHRDTIIHKDTVIHIDTLLVGPAHVRFISFLDNGSSITLKSSSGNNAPPIASATPQSIKSYLPIRSDTSLTIYATFSDGSLLKNSLFVIPSLGPQELVTIALFQTGNDLSPVFGVDSAIAQQAPPGFAWLRLINGVSDFPVPSPRVNAWFDTFSNPPVYRDPMTHAEADVPYQGLANYVLVPSGQHTVLIKGPTGSTAIYTASHFFVDGGYYTFRTTGSRAAATDRASIDDE